MKKKVAAASKKARDVGATGADRRACRRQCMASVSQHASVITLRDHVGFHFMYSSREGLCIGVTADFWFIWGIFRGSFGYDFFSS